MENSSLNLVVFIAMMFATMQLQGTMAQTRHVVGGSLGWAIPSNGAVAYTNWVSLQTFTVDDLLFFNFTDGQHDVAEVSAAAYGRCSATNPISLATNGPATITLTWPGTHYYICTFRSHCQIGQKLTINVSEAASPTPPSATPGTPVSPPTNRPPPPPLVKPKTPASPPTTSPTPPSPTSTTPFAPCPRTSSPDSDNSSPPTTTPSSTSPPPSTPSGGTPSFTAVVPAATFLIIRLILLNIRF